MIIFHGIFSKAEDMEDLVGLIQRDHPGTEVHNIDGFDDLKSMTEMWKQVASIKSKMMPIFNSTTDGVNMICFSQGKVVCVCVCMRGVYTCACVHVYSVCVCVCGWMWVYMCVITLSIVNDVQNLQISTRQCDNLGK